MNYVTLRTPTATCQIALHGAHVTSYIRDDVERLFVSEQALLDGSKAIRGGIPICWPWFGQLHPDIQTHQIAHGLVRNQPWQVIAQITTEHESSVTLSPSYTDHPLWPKGLECKIKITLNDALEIRLISTNSGAQSVRFTGALHTYFAVSNVADIQIEGLEHPHQFIDNNLGIPEDFSVATYQIKGEVDRIHLLAVPTTQIMAADTRVKIGHQGHDSLVVWNPGPIKAQALNDLGAEEYRQFVCIETAITQGLELTSKAEHELIQVIY